MLFLAKAIQILSLAMFIQFVHGSSLEITNIPEVKKILDECKKSVAIENVADCAWGEVKRDSNLKRRVEELNRSLILRENRGDHYRTEDEIFNFSTGPVPVKLREIVKVKIEELLYGHNEESDRSKNLAHSSFNEIYKYQILQNMVDGLTSFCMKADIDKISQKKIESGKLISISNSLTCEGVKYGTKDTAEHNLSLAEKNNLNSEKFLVCIENIPCLCEQKEKEQINVDACLVISRLKSLRKNLLANDKILDFYKIHAPIGSPLASNFKNEDIAQAITITSGDFNSITGTGDNVNSRAGTSLGENNIWEYGIRDAIREEELLSTIGNKEGDPLRGYLKSLGYEDRESQRIDSEENILALRDRIKKQSAEQRKSIILEMNRKLDALVNKNKQKSPARDEINKKDLQEMIRFSNITTSYLNTESKDHGVEKNSTNRLKQEVESEKENRKNDELKRNLVNKDSDSEPSFFSLENLNKFLGLGN